MKERRNWRDTIAAVNYNKVRKVFYVLIIPPAFYYFYFVNDAGLLWSLALTFMTLWSVVLTLIIGYIFVGIMFQILSFVFELTKPIFRWFLR